MKHGGKQLWAHNWLFYSKENPPSQGQINRGDTPIYVVSIFRYVFKAFASLCRQILGTWKSSDQAARSFSEDMAIVRQIQLDHGRPTAESLVLWVGNDSAFVPVNTSFPLVVLDIPFGNQSWLAGKSLLNEGFHGKIIHKRWIFQPAIFDYPLVI